MALAWEKAIHDRKGGQVHFIQELSELPEVEVTDDV